MPFPIIINRFGVYHWSSFEFDNKTSKNKYFIALNCSFNEIEFCVLLATSQVEKYQRFQNRLIDTIFIEKNKSRYFKVDTIIDLKNIQTIETKKFQKAIYENKINYLGLIEEDIKEKIIKTIKNAKTLSKIIKNKLLCFEKQ